MPSKRTEHGAFVAVVHSIVNVQYTNSDFNMFIYVLYYDIKLSRLRSFVRLFVRSMHPDSNASLPNSNVATWQPTRQRVPADEATLHRSVRSRGTIMFTYFRYFLASRLVERSQRLLCRTMNMTGHYSVLQTHSINPQLFFDVLLAR